jgi:phosphoribosyl 1,2-cyclic phosphate phosphodiesterase
MRVTFLGTGTSVGVPVIGCDCDTCVSSDPRDKRLRTSVLLEYSGRRVLIDACTDFRQQSLRHKLDRIDAVLFTHAHADHCFGLDDLRPIMFRNGAIPCYASEETWKGLRRIYSYVFEPGSYSGAPRVIPNTIDAGFQLHGLTVEPLTVMHGSLAVTAYRIGDFAYVTDCNVIPRQTCGQLLGLDVLVIDALRFKPHPTHLTLDDSLTYIRKLAPRRAFLTHLSHEIRHSETGRMLPAGVEIAYDGLEVDTN